ncbi:unnamed protein product [Durusdinium trenchii]|uniref:ANK_REP_REGION domain-containing protein n=2 Tax=Durusdinium trenchii TaxID=1381693 RepID=A0ABP0Q9H6_9DINO
MAAMDATHDLLPYGLLPGSISTPKAVTAEGVEPLEPRPKGVRRRMARLKRRRNLEVFLREHGFKDVLEPQQVRGCLFRPEVFYPIHEAARQGEADLVRQMLRLGADPQQKSSKGRTPKELALSANQEDSHAMVLMLLDGVQVLHLRDAIEIMNQARELT